MIFKQSLVMHGTYVSLECILTIDVTKSEQNRCGRFWPSPLVTRPRSVGPSCHLCSEKRCELSLVGLCLAPRVCTVETMGVASRCLANGSRRIPFSPYRSRDGLRAVQLCSKQNALHLHDGVMS